MTPTPGLNKQQLIEALAKLMPKPDGKVESIIFGSASMKSLFLARQLSEPSPLPCEREAFENFAENNWLGHYCISRLEDGRYSSSHTQLMWLTWQARATLNPSSAKE